jgi:hypothetical protein
MRLLLTVVAISLATPAWSQQTGSLKVRFVYGGEPFEPEPLNIRQFCRENPPVKERLLGIRLNGGIKNVVFYVYTGRGGSKLPLQPPRNVTRELVAQNCRFEPRITFLQSGDILHLSNRDAFGYNLNVNFFANPPSNVALGSEAKVAIDTTKGEPAPIPIDCNIHPWMRAYIVALDHPFAGISDEDGLIEISGLPAGGELIFRLYHEAADGPIKQVLISGEPGIGKSRLADAFASRARALDARVLWGRAVDWLF